MYVPLHYQISEYDCVPTALINAVSYLFKRKEVPPMVIRHIFLYCLDTVGRDCRFGIGGTSKYAVRLVGNWLNAYRMKNFSVHTEFLEQEEVCLNKESRIRNCLRGGGVALCNILLTPKEEHYLMIMGVAKGWVYCFDSYRRIGLRGMQGNVKILQPDDGRSPNLKIKEAWLERNTTERFCFGPIAQRESLLIWRNG